MKRIFKIFIYKFLLIISTILPSVKNWIIRVFYRIWHPIVNDLKYNNKLIQYVSTGYYPTLYKTQSSYYIRLLRKWKYDNNLIPMTLYKGILYYNPVQIVQFGLLEYGLYLTDKNPNHISNAKKIADWLVENQDINTGYWSYNFDYDFKSIDYVMKKPWHSAMAQGQAVSLLCRLYHYTKSEKYINAAILAIKPFEITVEEGGLLAHFNGNPFYEEYPTQPANFTLNGFIFSLFGLYDLFYINGDQKAYYLYNQGIDSLVKMLPLYDDTITSYYDLTHITFPGSKPIVNIKYHILHVILLKNIYSIHNNDILKFYINKWAKM